MRVNDSDGIDEPRTGTASEWPLVAVPGAEPGSPTNTAHSSTYMHALEAEEEEVQYVSGYPSLQSPITWSHVTPARGRDQSRSATQSSI